MNLMEIASKAEPFLIHADFILPSGKGVVKMRVDEVVDRSVKKVQDDAKFSEGAQQWNICKAWCDKADNSQYSAKSA